MDLDQPQRKPRKIVTVFTQGYSSYGRDVLHGVYDYLQTALPNWHLQIELKPSPESDRYYWDNSDGAIYASSGHILLETLLVDNKPIISTLAHFEDYGLPTVTVDDYHIGRLAAKFFIQKGFEHFCYYSGGDDSKASRLRYQGYQDVLEETLHLKATHLPANLLYDAVRRKKLLNVGHRVGLFCEHDGIARDMISRLIIDNIDVPNQVSVLGVDNDQLQCQIAKPNLTSIELPYRDLGFQAAEQLDALLNTGKCAKKILLSPHDVVERQSTDLLAIENNSLQKALAYIKAHACDPCNVKDVVAHSGVSRRVLESLFKDYIRMTPHEAINKTRMERAKRLLRESHESITLIADRCGYDLVQTFSRAFLLFSGETPSAYRKRLHVYYLH